MRHKKLGLVLALPLMMSLTSPSFSSDTGTANREMVAAVTAWNEAAALTGNDPATQGKKADLLQQVVGRLEGIVTNHPDSDLAVRLITGEAIGPLSLDGAKKALVEAGAQQAQEQCRSAPTQDCIFEEALASVDALSAVSRRPVLGKLAVMMAEAGREEDAEAILAGFDPAELGLSHAIGYAKAKKDAAGLARARDMAISGDRPGDAEDVAVAQAELGLQEEAQETLARFQDEGKKGFATAAVAAVFVRQGKLETALGMADDLEGDNGRSATRRSIALAQFEAGDKAPAIVTARQIEDRVWRAMALVAILDPKNDQDAFRAALLSLEGEGSEAIEMVGELAVLAYAKAGMFDRALEIAASNPDGVSRDQSFVQIAEEQAKAGLVEEGLKTAAMIDYPRSVGYALEGMARAQAASGNIDAAILIARGIEDDHDRMEAICEAAVAAAEAGKVGDAIGVLRNVDPAETCRAESLGKVAAGLES